MAWWLGGLMAGWLDGWMAGKIVLSSQFASQKNQAKSGKSASHPIMWANHSKPYSHPTI